MDEVVHISREDLFQPVVDSTLAHQKALVRQSEPVVDQPISGLRRLLLSNLFYTPFAAWLGALTSWLILEPQINEANATINGPVWLLLPMTATLIVLFIFLSEGIASRRFRGNLGRWGRGTGFTLVFSFLAYFPIGLIFLALAAVFNPPPDELKHITAWPASFFIGWVTSRTLAWTVMGVALGLAMNLMRSTKTQRRASVMGGAVGGALGGLLFDPINRFLFPTLDNAYLLRFVGFCTLGLCVGAFVALSERLGREGWVRVRTGPLRGKAFILYQNPTVVGSSPNANIYLFKDPNIAPEHAALHRIGGGYELLDTSSVDDASPVFINGAAVHRRRLVSGDQITIGDTILEFEERAKRSIQPEVKKATT